ncbi:MAG: transcriptional regulator [Bdellovibrionales bacterium RIFOXYD1_FULL_53_11]|nr:MAG: transcriptional regulator [Bdellovibrionales bacterium RIFOXYD1_FULL_53_11]
MGMEIKRFDVFLISLDPTQGSEIQKTRPCLVVSPDEMNQYLHTIIIAPMTSRCREYPTRIPCHQGGKEGEIVLDQLRTVDRGRLIKKLGSLDDRTRRAVLHGLAELFAP